MTGNGPSLQRAEEITTEASLVLQPTHHMEGAVRHIIISSSSIGGQA
jgi:hypothetical protein